MSTNPMIEPNDTIPEATETGIGLGDHETFIAVGFIGDNPNIAPELDVDLVAFELDAGDRATITVSDPNAGGTYDTHTVQLFDSSGAALSSSGIDGGLDFIAGAGGTYYAGVSGALNSEYDPAVEGSGGVGFENPIATGEYTIELATSAFVDGLPERNDTLAMATDSGIRFGEHETFIAKSFIGNNPNIAPELDVDLVAFEPPLPG
jgi:hypothetical protein